MLEAEVQVIDAVISFSHENDPVSDDWHSIKTALAELGKSPNSQSDAIALCQQGRTEAMRLVLPWFAHIFQRIEAAVLAQQHQ